MPPPVPPTLLTKGTGKKLPPKTPPRRRTKPKSMASRSNFEGTEAG